MTDFRQSAFTREILSGGVAQISQSALAREVLLSQVTQLWQSTLAREILLTGNPVITKQIQTAVTVSVS